jgi:hypothetical protein
VGGWVACRQIDHTAFAGWMVVRPQRRPGKARRKVRESRLPDPQEPGYRATREQDETDDTDGVQPVLADFELGFHGLGPPSHLLFDSGLFGGFVSGLTVATGTHHEQRHDQDGFVAHQTTILSGSAWPGSHRRHSFLYWHQEHCMPG